MKIVVTYTLSTEVDMPKEIIDEIINSEGIDGGDVAQGYILDRYPKIANALSLFEGEITGVYSPYDTDTDYDEVIWEE